MTVFNANLKEAKNDDTVSQKNSLTLNTYINIFLLMRIDVKKECKHSSE